MSCNRCAKTFSVFTKEHGCTNCRFSFCSKCLNQKTTVPRMGDSKAYPVCPGCYQQLTNQQQAIRNTKQTVHNVPPHNLPPDPLPPPSMRSSMAQGYSQPVSCRTKQTTETQVKEDRELAERLERIRQDRQTNERPLPTQEELEARLTNLRGCDPELIRNPRQMFYETPDRRTDTEKQRDLMKQMKEETELDNRMPNKDNEITDRLAKLRDEPEKEKIDKEKIDIPSDDNSKNTFDTSDINSSNDLSSSTNEETSKIASEVQEFINKAKNEAQVEAKAAMEALEKDKQIQLQLKRIREQTRQETMKDENISKELGAYWDKSDDEIESDDDDDSEAQKITKMVIEQAELEERLGRLSDPPPDPVHSNEKPEKSKKKSKAKVTEGSSIAEKTESESSEKSDNEDMPWCCICTEDAQVRCSGCDGDLYCRNCYKEGHDREDYKQHKWVTYKKKMKIETQV